MWAEMRFWLHLSVKVVSRVCEWLGEGDHPNRVTLLPVPEVKSYANEKELVKRQGAKEVLDIFLSYGEDEEDEIFVRTMWWCLVVALVIYCIKRLDGISRVL